MNKIALGIVSAFVGGAMLVTGAGAASATKVDTELKIRSITPNPVVVEDGAETTAFIDVGASPDVKKVEVIVTPEDNRFRTMNAKDVRHLQSWRFSVGFNENDPEGKWKAVATAFDDKGKEIAKDESFFAVEIEKGQAETRISRFAAEPERVRKGKPIFFSGRLQVDEEDGWEGVRGEKVSIYFRANSSNTWKWVASATTGRSGKFYAKATAYRSGKFRAVFAGDDELEGSKSYSEYVRVFGSWWRR